MSTEAGKTTTEAKKPWRKVLYEKQDYPDNYVDAQFLKDLTKNVRVRHYDYWSVVNESAIIAQQLCSVCALVLVWWHLSEGSLSPLLCVCVGLLLTLVGYALHEELSGGGGRSRLADVKSAIFFLGFSYGFSPILKTLTDTISTDTIYAMTTLMLLGHLLLFDYGMSPKRVTSLSMAVFGAVCLASRLPTAPHAFAITAFAYQIFALWPSLQLIIKRRCPATHVCVSVSWSLVSLAMLYHVGGARAAVAALGLLALPTLLAPLALVALQPSKDNIHGPWDEAEIKDDDIASFLSQ
ncbi:unnamed protein product [Lampetra fluviatilis]